MNVLLTDYDYLGAIYIMASSWHVTNGTVFFCFVILECLSDNILT